MFGLTFSIRGKATREYVGTLVVLIAGVLLMPTAHAQSRTRLRAQSRTKYEVPTNVNRYLALDWNLVRYRRAKFGSSAYTSLAWIFDWTPAWDSEWPTRSPNTDRITPTVDLITLLSPAASLFLDGLRPLCSQPFRSYDRVRDLKVRVKSPRDRIEN